MALMRASLFLFVLCVQGTGYVSPAAAQNTAGEVAYVESVNGRALAMVQGKPTLLDSLDVIDEKTRIDLLAGSELRLCHYRTQRIFTLTGPLRASVTDAGVAGEKGNAIAPSAETCVRPVMSNFQGGIIARTTGIPVDQGRVAARDQDRRSFAERHPQHRALGQRAAHDRGVVREKYGAADARRWPVLPAGGRPE